MRLLELEVGSALARHVGDHPRSMVPSPIPTTVLLPLRSTMGDSNSSPTGEPLASTKSSEKLSAKDIKDEVKQRIAREKLATPEPLRNVLKEHSGVNDCLPCRVMGMSKYAFVGRS